MIKLTEVETHAISKINMEINQGEFLAVTGPSVSGKSTLLHIPGCLDTPSAGRYTLVGADVTNLTAEFLATVIVHIVVCARPACP